MLLRLANAASLALLGLALLHLGCNQTREVAPNWCLWFLQEFQDVPSLPLVASTPHRANSRVTQSVAISSTSVESTPHRANSRVLEFHLKPQGGEAPSTGLLPVWLLTLQAAIDVCCTAAKESSQSFGIHACPSIGRQSAASYSVRITGPEPSSSPMLVQFSSASCVQFLFLFAKKNLHWTHHFDRCGQPCTPCPSWHWML